MRCAESSVEPACPSGVRVAVKFKWAPRQRSATIRVPVQQEGVVSQRSAHSKTDTLLHVPPLRPGPRRGRHLGVGVVGTDWGEGGAKVSAETAGAHTETSRFNSTTLSGRRSVRGRENLANTPAEFEAAAPVAVPAAEGIHRLPRPVGA